MEPDADRREGKPHRALAERQEGRVVRHRQPRLGRGLQREQVQAVSELFQSAKRISRDTGRPPWHAQAAQHPHPGAAMRFTTALLVVLCAAALSAQQSTPKQQAPKQPEPAPTGYKDTPMQPNGKW